MRYVNMLYSITIKVHPQFVDLYLFWINVRYYCLCHVTSHLNADSED